MTPDKDLGLLALREALEAEHDALNDPLHSTVVALKNTAQAAKEIEARIRIETLRGARLNLEGHISLNAPEHLRPGILQAATELLVEEERLMAEKEAGG